MTPSRLVLAALVIAGLAIAITFWVGNATSPRASDCLPQPEAAKKVDAITRDETGTVHELVNRARANAVLKKARPELFSDANESDADPESLATRKRERDEARRERDLEQRMKQVAMLKVIEGIESEGATEPELCLIVETLCSHGFADAALQRRFGDGAEVKQLVDAAREMTAARLHALIFEIAVGDGAELNALANLSGSSMAELRAQAQALGEAA